MIGAHLVSIFLSLTTFAEPAPASSVDILVLRENGAGSASTAQQFIDRVMDTVAKVNGWSGAKGAYHTRRDKAEAYIAAEQPHFGIVNLSAFLALRKQHDLDVLGTADVRGGGGGQYFIVSKKNGGLEVCKGQPLTTNHAEDTRFLEQVVARGQWKLAEFQLDKTQRPLQTLKKVIRDEAPCALVDDAQLADLRNLEGGDAVKTVWSSAKLVPMLVVAFARAPEAEAKSFRSNLKKVCTGAGREACEEAGLAKLEPAAARDVSALVTAYER